MKSAHNKIILSAALAVLSLAPIAAADEAIGITTNFKLNGKEATPIYQQSNPGIAPPLLRLCASKSDFDIIISGSEAMIATLEPDQCLITSDTKISATSGDKNHKAIAKRAEDLEKALAGLGERVAELEANPPLDEVEQALVDRFRQRRDEGVGIDFRNLTQPVSLYATPIWKEK